MASALLLAVVVGVLAVVLPSVFANGDDVDEVLESDTRLVQRRRSARVDRWAQAASRALGAPHDEEEWDDRDRRDAVVRGDDRVEVVQRVEVVEHLVETGYDEQVYADELDEYDADLDDEVGHRPAPHRVLAARLVEARAARSGRAAADTPQARRERRLRRRRRTLVGLVAGSVGLLLLGIVVPGVLWVGGLTLAATVGFVSYLRREAQREARWRARSRRAGYPLVSRRDVEDVRRTSTAAAPPAVGTDTWEPVPVPEPTYVRLAREAKEQEITSRTLLSWRTAEIDAALVDEDADPVEETVAMFDEVVERRRAVGDW